MHDPVRFGWCWQGEASFPPRRGTQNAKRAFVHAVVYRDSSGNPGIGIGTKNNHIAAAGGVRNAIERARASGLPVEVEIHTREELREALDAGAGWLLLDNLTPEEAARWVREIGGRAQVELSGGITLANVRAYAETGADFVSSGAITHSARAMDISFRLEVV